MKRFGSLLRRLSERARRLGSVGRLAASIRGKLILAFGAIAAMTVLASLIGVLSYQSIAQMMARITNENLPAMSLSSRLSKTSAGIVAAAPLMVAASDDKQRESIQGTLTSLPRQLDHDISALSQSTGDTAVVAALHKTADELGRNLDELAQSVTRRLALNTERNSTVAQVRAYYDTLARMIAPWLTTQPSISSPACRARPRAARRMHCRTISTTSATSSCPSCRRCSTCMRMPILSWAC